MNEVMNFGEAIIGGADGPTSIFVAGKFNVTAMAVIIIIGLIFGFFGLKLMRVLTVICGFLLGLILGLIVAAAVGTSGNVFAVIMFGCAVVFALLAFFIRRFGSFCIAFLCSVGTAVVITGTSFAMPSLLVLIVVLVASVIIGVLAAAFMEPVIVMITALSGGLAAGVFIAQILDAAGVQSPGWLGYAVGAVLTIVSMLTQFVMYSRKIKIKEEMYADEIKESDSMESEIEKARIVLEGEEEEDEEE